MNLFYQDKDFLFDQIPDLNCYIEKIHIYEKGHTL